MDRQAIEEACAEAEVAFVQIKHPVAIVDGRTISSSSWAVDDIDDFKTHLIESKADTFYFLSVDPYTFRNELTYETHTHYKLRGFFR